MKVALIGDVHANLPALEAVLADAYQRKVEAIWNIGDFVGYGAFPEEVIKRLQQEEVLSIAGNYDLKVLKVKEKKGKLSEKRLAFNWTYDNLSKPSRRYLSSLPKEIRLEAEGKRILLTHGSPASNKEYINHNTPEERLRELAGMAGADIVICGHSHQPFRRKVEGVWFINTGSVGRPDDGDPRACYATLQIKPRFFQLYHYRVEYDVEGAVAAIRERGLPEAFAQMILQGRNLDTVLETAGADEVEEAIQSPDSTTGGYDKALEAVLRLAESCKYEAEHTHQVTRLALQLFDELQAVHHLGAKERFWLQAGALLHDIGWIKGQKRHHKISLRIILNASPLPFDDRERLIIGSIARYHRRALPSRKHGHFAALKPSERKIVSVLAAILRVADGLDRTQRSLVESLSCKVTPKQIVVQCSVSFPAEIECQAALKKGDLLEQVFQRNLTIELQQS